MGSKKNLLNDSELENVAGGKNEELDTRKDLYESLILSEGGAGMTGNDRVGPQTYDCSGLVS